jgi:hypothetical protein
MRTYTISAPPFTLANRRALTAFWMSAAALAGFHLYMFFEDSSLRVAAAGLISLAALVPAYFWCTRPEMGLPLYPMFALMFIPQYAYPLAGQEIMITMHDDDEGAVAGLTVATFLFVGTAAWLFALKVFRRPTGFVRSMPEGRGEVFFLALIFLAAGFNMGMVGNWFEISGGALSIIRATLMGLASIGMFLLPYRWAQGQLSIPKKWLFAIGFILYATATMVSLIMIGAMIAIAFASAAYVIGGGRLPWKLGAIVLVLFGVLHAGKGEMRDIYWTWLDYKPIQVVEYPGFMIEWFERGLKEIQQPTPLEESGTFGQRIDLIHLLLKVQAETPERRPYMNGQTYAVIPNLILPRMLNPKKLNSHESAHLMSIYYGLQTREGTETSTIAWGPLNEAYANFGMIGVVGAAFFIGFLYGGVAKKALGAPILSLRMMIAIVFAALALQVEWTAGPYTTALFQSLVVVCGMGFVLMQPTRIRFEPALPSRRRQFA